MALSNDKAYSIFNIQYTGLDRFYGNEFNVIKNRIASLSANQKVVLTNLLCILFVLGFTYLTVLNEKAALYQQLDNQLKDAARVTESLLPSPLHHHNITQHALNDDQKMAHINALSDFTDQRDITYVYSPIKRHDKILFTSSSATPEERESGEQLNFYYDHYDEVAPRVFEVFKTKKTSFLQYTDQWGDFSQCFYSKLFSR